METDGRFMELPSREQAPLYGCSLREMVAREQELVALDELMDELAVGVLEARYRRVGHPAYPVRMMLKAILYGSLRGIRSSRQLEEACRLHLGFRYLTHGMEPDHQAFCRFRRRHQDDLEQVFTQTVVLCAEAGLVGMSEVAVDGSKVRANRSPETLQRIRKYWREQLAAAEQADVADGLAADTEGEVREQVQAEQGEECQFMGQQPRVEPGYNAQVAVDGKHQVIVGMDLVTSAVDHGQLAPLVEQVVENTGQVPERVLADGGYWRQECVEQVGALGAAVHMPVPPNMQTSEGFVWVAEQGAYRCPAGHWLRAYRQRQGKQIYRTSRCRGCAHASRCGVTGRFKEKSMLDPTGATAQLQRRMQTEAGRAVYARRKQIVEPVWGWMKFNRHFARFLLRGRRGAKAELAFMCIIHNLVRLLAVAGMGTDGRGGASCPRRLALTALSAAARLRGAMHTLLGSLRDALAGQHRLASLQAA